MENPENNTSYEASNVKALDGVSLIRTRPSLFLDGLDADGLHRLLFEAIDNAVDEHQSGFGREITVSLDSEGWIEVRDEGRGMPTENHPETGEPTPVFLMTKVFAGAKFDGGAYNLSGGLHGVGLKCINAFSEQVILSTQRGGRGYVYRFQGGLAVDVSEGSGLKGDGTSVKFLPDYKAFGGARLDRERVVGRLEDISHLNPGLKCILQTGDEQEEFFAERGILGLMEDRGCEDLFCGEMAGEGIEIQCYMGSEVHADTNLLSYANGIPTPEGGSHVTGVKTGIAKATTSYAARRNLLKDSDPPVTGNEVGEGCFLVVLLRMEAPPFSSQKKTKIVSTEVEQFTIQSTIQIFSQWLEENPSRAKRHVSRMLQAARNREKLRALRSKLRLVSKAKKGGTIRGLLSGGKKPSTLLLSVRDCHWRKHGREGVDVLPLSFKQNPAPGRTPLERLLRHVDYFSLVGAIGGGVGKPEAGMEGGEHEGNTGFDLSKVAYKKIVVSPGEEADAVLSGAFVLAFMEKFLPGLVESGMVFWRERDGEGEEAERAVTSAQRLKAEPFGMDLGGGSAESPEDGEGERDDEQ